MEESALVQEEWRWVEGLLPDDLERSAADRLALRRRREISCASDLLRLVLAYAVCDFSLRQTAAWASVIGLGQLSDVAVLKRLRGAADWVGSLVMQCLQERGVRAGARVQRVRIVDATVVSKPGSSGTDWRLHLGLDLADQSIRSFELTGVEGGETFQRLTIERGELMVADRCYSHGAAVASVIERGGHVLVRFASHTFPLLTRAGAPVDTDALLETLGDGEIGDWPLAFRSRKVLHRARLIAVRKSTAAAELERRRVRHEAIKKGRPLSARSLAGTKFVAIVTDLEATLLPAVDALELYRLRWQVEIAFKRLKSLLDLDRLRARDPALARCYLYAKLLAAVLIDDLCQRLPAFSPWGYPLVPSSRQPLAIAATLD
jgi:Transposase DDE domain